MVMAIAKGPLEQDDILDPAHARPDTLLDEFLDATADGKRAPTVFRHFWKERKALAGSGLVEGRGDLRRIAHGREIARPELFLSSGLGEDLSGTVHAPSL
jgi:hypothetical protein